MMITLSFEDAGNSDLSDAREVQECWNDLKYYRDEIRALFRESGFTAVTARSERAYLYLIMKIKQVLRDPEAMTEDMKQALVQVADIITVTSACSRACQMSGRLTRYTL